jgi:hypothetical protein
MAQAVNLSQQVSTLGLRSTAGHGRLAGAVYAADGSLYLLDDEHDGIRVLKTDSTGTTLLAQAHLGATGDLPVALALDPVGNVYVTGTATSGALSGTTGAAFSTTADTSTNSFLAKLDANLNPVFVTFLGSGRTAATGVTVTADAIFVTGITFSATLPVTPAGIQQQPASGSSENGFVERFSTDGSTLVYATYLTGVGGNTMPAAIVADSSDSAYIAGATTATGYPTINALVPVMIAGSSGALSGFLSSLSANGSSFSFSTFMPGTGITSLALDAASNSLLLSGNIALGQFPVARVSAPLAATSYQTLLRIPVDGQSMSDSVLLVPGTQSYVSAGPNGTAWISGTLGTPLFPGDAPPDYSAGDSFLLHRTSDRSGTNVFDQTMRFGGLPVNNPAHASLASSLTAPAVSADGSTVTIAGQITAIVDSSLLATQHFDLPLVAAPSATLPSTLSDVLNFSCTNSSACTGTAGLLAQVTTASAAPSLSLSTHDLPNLTLRNLGSATATGIAINGTGYSVATNCTTTLAPSNQCSLALTGTGPGSITITAANTATATATLPASSTAAAPLALSTSELDFGILSSVDGTANLTVSVTNLTASTQSFSSALDGTASTKYAVAETASTCGAGTTSGTHTLTANASCTVTLGITPSANAANDSPVRLTWKIGSRDVVLTAITQAAALNLSASEIDFGTEYLGLTQRNLPRYLYLSNNSNAAIAHTPVSLPASSPFSVTDTCPVTLEPNTVCSIAIRYLATTAPSTDSATLALDGGLSALLTGTTMPQATATATVANPSLSVSTTTINFPTTVAVTQVASAQQSVLVANTGSSSFPLSITTTGDFTVANGCPTVLPGGSSCMLQIGFAPSQPGVRTGLISLSAGASFTPTYITLSGTGSAILPPNNGVLALGETYAGEPLVDWYKLQQPLASLTVASNSASFGIALVEDTGNGHGTLPASAFASSATNSCANCWLGVQFLVQSPGAETAQLTLSSNAGGNTEPLLVSATALPVSGQLLTPITQDFGSLAVHSVSAPIVFTYTNLLAGAAAAQVQSIAATGDFSIVPNMTGGMNCTGTIAATNACFVQVAFAPTATGQRQGALSIVTNAGTVQASLTGYGLADTGLALSPVALSFNNVPGPSATQQTIVVTNTGSSDLTITSPTASNQAFTLSSNCSTLAAGASCNIVVVFTPQSATVQATLALTSSRIINGQTIQSTTSVALNGNYTTQNGALEILPSAVNFGATATSAQGSTQSFTLNNLSGRSVAIALSMPRQFPLATPSSCGTLAPGASCSFAVTFLPVTGGALTGTITATGTPTNGSSTVQTLAYALGYGVGSGSLAITGLPIPNTPLSFGQVSSGQTAQQTLTLTNIGTVSLTVHRITTLPPFYATSNCGAALAAHASCTATLTYAPIDQIASGGSSLPRTDSGVLTIESDAATSPDTVLLSGTAAPVVSSSPTSSAVLNALGLSNSALTFANTQVGDLSAAQTVTLTNLGSTTIRVSSIVAPTDFVVTDNCATLLPGVSCSAQVSFTPGASTSSLLRSGTLEIRSDAGKALEYVSLLGSSSAAPLSFSASTLDFGSVNVGTTDALSLTVTNMLATPVVFTGLATTGDYTVAAGTCPANGNALPGNATCTLTITFVPTASGVRSGALSLASAATQLPLTVSLTGDGIAGQLQITPGALAFGNIDVGSTATLQLTLLNTGSAPIVNISNTISGSNAALFQVTSPCTITILAPNQSCVERVSFSPNAVAAAAATLTIASSDPQGPSAIALTGTGAAGGAFTLTVNGSSSATVTVQSGAPANYNLTLTPLHGFTGTVALTCAAINAGPHATCSISGSTLTLGASPQTATATINTITTAAVASGAALGCVLGICLMPRRRRNRSALWVAIILAAALLSMTGCGGNSASNLLYTPYGSYQYQVTASSTSGAVLSSSVTLQLVVQ